MKYYVDTVIVHRQEITDPKIIEQLKGRDHSFGIRNYLRPGEDILVISDSNQHHLIVKERQDDALIFENRKEVVDNGKK